MRSLRIALILCVSTSLWAQQLLDTPKFPQGAYFRQYFGKEVPRVELQPPVRLQDFVAGDQALRALFPETAAVRVIVSHMRPEPTLGLMRRIDTGARQTRALGYQARGGTLDVAGMLFANRCTWAHVAAEAAQGLGVDPQSLLSAEEWAAGQGRGDPRVITVSA